jgi:Ca2+-dependent lipid-binding protein
MDRTSYVSPLDTSDPFVIVRSGRVVLYRTEIKKATLRPIWEEMTQVSLSHIHNDEIGFYVFDYDLLGQNDRLGYCLFNVKDLKNQRAFSDWIPLKNVASGSIRITIFYLEPSSPKDTSHEVLQPAITENPSSTLLTCERGKYIVSRSCI